MGTTPLDLVLSRPTPGIVLKGESVASLHGVDDFHRTTVELMMETLERGRKGLGAVQVQLMASQRRYPADLDRKVTTVETCRTVEGEESFVDITPSTKRSLLKATDMDKALEPSKKLMAKAKGP